MRNLLILSSDTGEGHNSAATALERAATQAGLHVSVRKPIEESGKSNQVWANLYNSLLTHRPQWMTRYFWLVGQCRPYEREFFYRKARPFIADFVESERPDVLLSVHPMLNHFIQRYIKEEQLPIPCVTFLTDPFPPFWGGWASPYIDRYFVPTAEALQALTAMGVHAERIEQVPMPVRPQFQPITTTEMAAVHSSLHLSDSSTILINGGARGGGPLFDIYRTVRQTSPQSNILVICGRNATLQHRIDTLKDSRTRTFGFVEDLHRYVGASDLVLTKPGALSTFEALACGVPVVLLGIKGLMPQESGMFQAALHYEFGFAARGLADIERIVHQGPQAWSRLRHSIAQFYLYSSGKELIERIQPQHVGA